MAARSHGNQSGRDVSDNHLQLQIVKSGATPSRFEIPDRWIVKEVPRAKQSQVDKYYIEPDTGYKFRSLKEVERYMKGEQSGPPIYERPRLKRRAKARALSLPPKSKHSSSRQKLKMIVSGGQMLRLHDETPRTLTSPRSAPVASFDGLPDGWVVEKVRRTHGGSDKYYYEPGTGQRFRSLLAVQRYLTELNDDSSLSSMVAELKENKTPLSKLFKLGNRLKNGSASKKIDSCDKKTSFSSPPSKLNWVISDSGGDKWDAFLGDTLILESVKQQWEKRFDLAINDVISKEPKLG